MWPEMLCYSVHAPFCFKQKDIKTICVILNDTAKGVLNNKDINPGDVMKYIEKEAEYHLTEYDVSEILAENLSSFLKERLRLALGPFYRKQKRQNFYCSFSIR